MFRPPGNGFGPGGAGGPPSMPTSAPPQFQRNGGSSHEAPHGEDRLDLGPDAGKRQDGAFAPFRPPGAYAEPAPEGASKDDLLLKLRAGGRLWFDNAPLFAALMRMGMSPAEIAEETGITPREQAAVTVESSVYKSLEASPEFPDDKLEYFHNPRLFALQELRETTGTRRFQAAEYVVDCEFDANEARELVKAYKLMDAFPAQRKGFSDAPGDALAFKLFRNAAEGGKRGSAAEGFEATVKRALRHAVTDTAVAKLEALLEAEAEEVVGVEAGAPAAEVKSEIYIVELQEREQSFISMPVLGAVNSLKASDFKSAPTAEPEGPFGVFQPSGRLKWVSLPAWSYIQDMRKPAAVFVPNASDVAGVPQLARLAGPAMLVVDRGQTENLFAKHYYVASQTSSIVGLDGAGGIEKVEIVGGGKIIGAQGWTVLGRVMMAMRPPQAGGGDEEDGMGATEMSLA